MVKIGSGQLAPIVILGVAALGLVLSCHAHDQLRGRLPRMNFNSVERTKQARRTNPPTNTGTNISTDTSASDLKTYEKNLALASERSLKQLKLKATRRVLIHANKKGLDEEHTAYR